MIAPLAKLMDWSVLQIGGAMLLWSTWQESVNERDLKLEKAVKFLVGPDFIPAESQPAQLDFIPDTSGCRFRFPTPRPCEFAENNVVHGRLYRCAEAWQERPVIILLHGGGDFPVISSEFTCWPAVAIGRDSMRRPWNCLTTFNAVHASMVY